MSEIASKKQNASEETDECSSEEEELVYLTFDTVLDSEFMQADTGFKIIGLDEEQPILQLGSQVYTGIWKDTLGTAVFLEEDPTAANGDPVFTKNPSAMLRFHSKTRKNLAMSRVFINPKGPQTVTDDADPDDPGNAYGIDDRIHCDMSNLSRVVPEEQAGCSYSEGNDNFESSQEESFLLDDSDRLDDESATTMDVDSACEQPPEDIDAQPSCSYAPYTIIKRER